MTTASPLQASILMPTKNAGELFEHVLRAIERQRQVNFEVIFVDSGSKDGTLKRIADFTKRVSFPVKLVKIPAHEFGHGKTRNLAARHARGEILVLLTHDASPCNAHWLSSMVAPFSHPKVGLVFGPQRPRPDANPMIRADLLGFFDGFAESGRTTTYASADTKQGAGIKFANEKPRGANRLGPANDPLFRFSSDANAAVRRSAWEECNFRDVTYCEDQLMARDLLERGWYKVFEPSAAVYHSHNFGTLEFFKRYNDEWQALYRVFGHTEVKRLWHLPLRIARAGLHSRRILLSDPRLSPARKAVWLPRALALATVRQIGGYIGPRLDKYPDWLRRNLSREAHLIRA